MHFRKFIQLCLICTLIFPISTFSQDAPIFSGNDIFHPIYGKRGMVASQEALATLAGAKVLQEGGNAIDAAVTVGFVLAVTLPRAGNIGGGGFMVVFDAKTKKAITIDYREKAPVKATADMFLDENGDVDNEKARFSLLSSGVPGTVAGFALALEKYGTYSLAKALAPAIHYAENGFPVSPGLSDSLKGLKKRFAKCPASMKIFFKNGECYEPGEMIYQKDLAQSLKKIAEEGTKAFYEGEIAQKIANEMQQNGGLISLEDLKIYRPSIRTPIYGSYRGYDVYSMPPPSSGGVHLVQMLNILEHYPLKKWGQNSAQTIHVMAEAMKLAYADRAKHLGDPDFVKVPISGIISKSYAKHLLSKINLQQATSSKKILADDPWKHESNDTTHFSVMDQYGNAVSNTYTLNFSYGSGFTVPGTGILLNNEMDDFVAKPGVPNAFGLLGGKANAIEPQKRMLSSMTPTIVVKDDKPFLVTGSPGGSRIITTTLQIILNVIDHDLNVAEASNMPRIHHQWYPDEIRTEKGLSFDTLDLLRQKGHKVVQKSVMGSTQSIMWDKGFFFGASDPRRVDALTVGVK
ncbi:gamma-glutamyltransferase [Candidatus Uabimicrobium amorphum]|uniref:Glutathione hydrolase proenzyme n=1 Tax=Uabimicrobium amorphum TaxID=2596890 RepID=A0A5S9F1Z3_UABAM|nr:gamma-glutamyltransferase [Candidatus Uabimicrobium amorphum]BBM82922.1 gamma-glutamyltransferase [Candidatus Uabimicrobium amorphum]